MLVALSVLMLAVVAEPDPTKGSRPPVVKFQKVENGALIFEVINRNAETLPYVGYTSDSIDGGLAKDVVAPLYRLEVCKDKACKPHAPGWCKTGVGAVSIPARSSVTFVVHPPQGDWDSFRVGLIWYKTADRKGGSNIAWSETVTREATAPKK